MLSACQAPPPGPEAGEAALAEIAGGSFERVYGSETGSLEQIRYRPAGSAEGQSWAYLDGARLVRIEVDEDGDGQVDRWEYYGTPAEVGAEPGDVAAGLRRTLERVDVSTRRDGVVTRQEYYEGGMLVRAEEDASGDGQIDKWETYDNGGLTMLALDTAGRGQPDRRFIYDGGELARVEVDPDGSGFELFSDGSR